MKSSLDALDWERARALLAAAAESPLGQRLLRSLVPFRSAEALAEAADTVAEADGLLRLQAAPSFARIDDLSPRLETARQRAAGLDGRELAQVLASVKAGEFVRRRLAGRTGSPRLTARARAIPDLEALVAQLERTVDALGAVLDDAAPELAEIRREIVPVERRVRELALDLAGRPEWRPHLRDGPPVARDGRFMLAVKAEARGRIAGVLHDRSASGETVFIEPEALLEPQNRLAELRARERRWVDRILLERTRDLLRQEAPLHESQRQLASLDALFARARFGRTMGGTIVPPAADGVLVLRRAFHPLLLHSAGAAGREAIVPFDLELGRNFDVLVISGPNTGGKTATLKAVGILVALALAAVPIPVDAGSAVPWFDEVHADIGDEQDLASNLSTFSGHLRRIADVLARVTPRSLVLLDELGTGTEPKEGEALGRALLLALLARGAKIVATTHLSGLKDLGFEVPRIENGSLEFDGDTLQPLFRLTLGLPGESNALKIARRHGIPAAIVEQADAWIHGSRGGEAARAREQAMKARTAALHHLEMAETSRRDAELVREKLRLEEASLAERATRLESERDLEVASALNAARDSGRELLAAIGSLPASVAARLEPLREWMEKLPNRAALSERRRSYLAGLRKGDAVFLPRYREHCVIRKIDLARETLTVLYRALPVELSWDEIALPGSPGGA
jgi:DNA mismatch repair protein MutS2